MGQVQGHSKSSSRRQVWRYDTDAVDPWVYPGSAVSARRAGDRTGLRAELQRSSGEPWTSELNLKWSSWTMGRRCGQSSKRKLFRAIKAH